MKMLLFRFHTLADLSLRLSLHRTYFLQRTIGINSKNEITAGIAATNYFLYTQWYHLSRDSVFFHP